MEKRVVDVAILGAGTAGLGAYRAARARGKSALLIHGGPFGTTCARVGCMPSKLLLAAADVHHEIHRAERFGIRVSGKVEVDGEAVMGRVRSERDRFVGFVLESINGLPQEDKLVGYGSFLGPHQLVVHSEPGGQGNELANVEAASIVIATGSSPAIPPPFRAFGSRLVVNDDVFEWHSLPESVAVFGPGVIGLELGQALHRLGVRVRLFGVGNLVGPVSDPAVADVTRRIFGEELYLDADVKTTEMGVDEDGAILGFIGKDGETHREHFEYVLAATGRRPNVAGLLLQNAGIQLDDRGLPVFEPTTMQCGQSHIFIAGDANNDRPLLHEAADEGRIAGDNAALYPEVKAGHRRASIAVVFSDPQIAAVGESHRTLSTGAGSSQDWVIGAVSFDDQGRSRVMLKNKGLLHVYADRKSGRLLGAEMVGPRAEHLAHLLAWSVQQRLTVPEMLLLPFYHPVVEEGLRTALRDAASKLQ